MKRQKNRLKIASSSLSSDFAITDWSKCCLCQKDCGGETVCSAKNPIKKNTGYSALAEAFKKLCPYNYVLLSGFSVAIYDEGQGFEANLISKSAMWHKSCGIKFTDKNHLKTLLTELQEQSESQSCTRELDTSVEGCSQNNIKTTRSKFEIPNVKKAICLICMGEATRKHILHRCETYGVCAQVKSCAEILVDIRLQTLFAEGDLLAQEAKFHTSCLAGLYNKCRQKKATSQTARDAIMCEGLAFSDIITHIKSKSLSLKGKCVFKMGDLRSLYHDRLAQLLGVDKSEVIVEKSTKYTCAIA